MAEIDDPQLTKVQKLAGRLEKLVFEAIKAGMAADLPHARRVAETHLS
jgi:hypothetical protein